MKIGIPPAIRRETAEPRFTYYECGDNLMPTRFVGGLKPEGMTELAFREALQAEGLSRADIEAAVRCALQ